MSFTLSEQGALRIRASLAARHLRVEDLHNVPVEVGLQTEDGYPHAGTLDYVNPGLDPATGTLAVRAVFANADRALVPGFFRVPVQRDVDALLMPETALGADQGGRYLLTVNAAHVVERRRVQAGPPEAGGMRVIESGLGPEDRVIVAGLQRAVPGDKVDPQPAESGAR